MQNDLLTEKIIGSAYTVANTLGYGFLEKVYENSMLIELHKQGLAAIQQHPIHVHYDGKVVGDYFADLLVESSVIVELKSAKELTDLHMAQCLNYLRATGYKTALLLNFGRPKIQVKRISL